MTISFCFWGLCGLWREMTAHSCFPIGHAIDSARRQSDSFYSIRGLRRAEPIQACRGRAAHPTSRSFACDQAPWLDRNDLAREIGSAAADGPARTHINGVVAGVAVGRQSLRESSGLGREAGWDRSWGVACKPAAPSPSLRSRLRRYDPTRIGRRATFAALTKAVAQPSTDFE